MTKKSTVSIDVLYQHVDGLHFFKAGDERAEGLCVAHHNAKVAYAEVSRQLTTLLGAPCHPAEAFEEFEAWLQGAMVQPTNKIASIPTAAVPWEQHLLAA